MIRRFLVGIAIFVVVLFCTGLIALAVTAPTPPDIASDSAKRLEPGPYTVGVRAHTFVDTSRPTAANRDVPGTPSRSLVSLIWYPENDAGNHPLVVYSHGFMSMKEEATYLAEQLASHGYVVVACDYPLTNLRTPGGPNVADFINQPADVSFLIDSVQGLSGGDRPFSGRIDPDRIAVMGLSLGGLTSTLAAFHPDKRDPRVRAAISIAGPSSFFGPRFYETSDAPFLMIAGTLDAMIDYDSHGRAVLERARNAGLVTIENGSHTGFASIADPLFRFVDHPDSIGCGALMENIDVDPAENPFAGLGGPEQGILADAEGVLPCQGDFPEALHPGRQQMVTRLAATAFLEGVFATDPAARERAKTFLAETLASDFGEARYEPSTL